MFDTDADQRESSSSPAEEDWPPFRKVLPHFLSVTDCYAVCHRRALNDTAICLSQP